ncbi:hypothetical protein A3K86_14035 [Photobacterium jeanii]|uniref:Uncharacterized protein n=1 Tax=Photobacterium jeanii TaxID=858640 RepID=A0A178K8L8_9GAMM|nr:hypothetical protein [Photobacterium jeanii]OAN13689.1 hypothetical protein A3K86_14035 [Photobacterium jeanii]PST88810.1 hypothetical protein C9I91_15900 [Photobacterium jeanii]
MVNLLYDGIKRMRLRKALLLCAGLFALNVHAQPNIPTPANWNFPDIADSARVIAPTNIAGIPFNEYGLAYSQDILANLDVLNLPATELQKYADVVTHAYPDATAERGMPDDCSQLPFEDLNETSFANIAYISINAIKTNNRQSAANCLLYLQTNLKESVRE